MAKVMNHRIEKLSALLSATEIQLNVQKTNEISIQRENSINIQNIEYKIKKNFDNINYKGTAGTEFFENSIIDDIEPYFNIIGVIYHKLTDNDINDLRRKHKEL